MEAQRDRNVQHMVSYQELLYYAAMCLILAGKAIGLDEGSMLFRTLLGLGTILIIIKIVRDGYSLKEWFYILILGFAGSYIFLTTGSLGIMVYAVLMAGMKNMRVENLLKVALGVWGIGLVFSCTLAIWGNRYGTRVVHEKFGLGPLLRESLGYTHPNVLHITYVVIMSTILYLYAKKGRSIWKLAIPMLLVDAWVFLYSMSTTGLLMSFASIVSFLYFLNRRTISAIERVLLYALLPVCLFISIIFPIVPEFSPLSIQVNKVFNNRLLATAIMYESRGIRLLGTREWVDRVSIDNSYAYVLFSYGILFFIVLMALLEVWMIHCVRKNKRREIAVMVAFLFGGISEPFIFNASTKNILIFMIGAWLFSILRSEGQNETAGSWNHQGLHLPIKNIRDNLFKYRWVWKSVSITVCIAAFLWMTVVLIVQLRVKTVYALPRSCDCDGEIVMLEEATEEHALYIGTMNVGEEVYRFSEEADYLLHVYKGRYVVTYGVCCAFIGYASAAICRKEHIGDACRKRVD